MSCTDKKNKQPEKTSYLPIIILSVVVLILGVVFVKYLYMVLDAMPKDDDFAFNNFGDAFGVMSALFSGLAFAGMIYAVLLQRQELSLQREELAETRAELAKSASAQNAQVKITNINAQLNAYSSMITLYSGIMQTKRMSDITKLDPYSAFGKLNAAVNSLNDLLEECESLNMGTEKPQVQPVTPPHP